MKIWVMCIYKLYAQSIPELSEKSVGCDDSQSKASAKIWSAVSSPILGAPLRPSSEDCKDMEGCTMIAAFWRLAAPFFLWFLGARLQCTTGVCWFTETRPAETSGERSRVHALVLHARCLRPPSGGTLSDSTALPGKAPFLQVPVLALPVLTWTWASQSSKSIEPDDNSELTFLSKHRL